MIEGSRVVIKGDVTKTIHTVYQFIRCAEGWAVELKYVPYLYLESDLIELDCTNNTYATQTV